MLNWVLFWSQKNKFFQRFLSTGFYFTTTHLWRFDIGEKTLLANPWFWLLRIPFKLCSLNKSRDGFAEQKLKLRCSFRCNQTYNSNGYHSGQTLFCCLSSRNWVLGHFMYTIRNILRLSIYTSMNHSLLFNLWALALQNILRHPVWHFR